MEEEDDAVSCKTRALELHAARGKAGAVPVSEGNQQAAAAPALHKLQPISIGELRAGKVHTGFALHGTLCAEAFRNQAVHTVLEDATGRAILVCIYNAALSSTTAAALKQRFPLGIKVAIKEPYLKTEKGGVLVLRVDNPLNFERVWMLPDAPPRIMDAETLRAEGSRLFLSKDWLAAAEAYTRCIALFSVSSSCRDKDLLAAALSNRAETWIRIGNFEQALSDANQAIKIDSSLVKALVRKCRALHGLHEYELALACMEKVAEVCRDNVTSLLQHLDVSVKQSRSGSFDIGSFLKSGRARDKAPLCADYVGAVSIQKSSIAGRGLFATRDVKAGELLLVSNALAVVCAESATVQWQGVVEDLVTKVAAVLVSSRKSLQQVNALLSTKAPSVDLFRPNWRWYPECFEMDNTKEVRFEADSIRKLVRDKCFGQFVWHKLEGMVNNADTMMESKCCGLWLLPSLINHSCFPNAAQLEVGKAMFVHAARDISAGQEITVAYFDALIPVQTRQEICQARWNFQCQCQRCVYERGVQSVALKKLYDQFKPLHDKALREINSAGEAGVEFPASLPACANFAQLCLRIESDAGLCKFLQASYAVAYLAGLAADEFFDEAQTKIPPGDDLMRAFRATVPGHWRSLIMQSAEYMKFRQYFDKDKWNDGILLMCKQDAYDLCRSTFGNQSQDVYDELIAQAAMLRPF